MTIAEKWATKLWAINTNIELFDVHPVEDVFFTVFLSNFGVVSISFFILFDFEEFGQGVLFLWHSDDFEPLFYFRHFGGAYKLLRPNHPKSGTVTEIQNFITNLFPTVSPVISCFSGLGKNGNLWQDSATYGMMRALIVVVKTSSTS